MKLSFDFSFNLKKPYLKVIPKDTHSFDEMKDSERERERVPISYLE